MKHFIMMLLAGLFVVALTGCDDGDDSPPTATQEEVVAAQCDMIQECNEAVYSSIPDCPSTVEAQIFTDCENFDAEKAGECLDAATAMECDEFNAALIAMMGGDGSGFPAACENMCP